MTFKKQSGNSSSFMGEMKALFRLYVLLKNADHVHCFVSAPPKLSVTDIARWLNGISGRHLLMEFPELSEKLWRGHLWNGSCFVE